MVRDSVSAHAQRGSDDSGTNPNARKVLAELEIADDLAPGSDRVRWSGDVFAEVMLVKGALGPAEDSGGDALSGPDGQAIRKALAALKFDPSAIFASVSRPEPAGDHAAQRRRLRMQIEAVDPFVILALDELAAQDLAACLDIEPLPFGRVVRDRGRSLCAVQGFEASLGDERLKARVWRQLRALSPEGPAW